MEGEAMGSTALAVQDRSMAMTVDELREQMAFEAARIEETKAFIKAHMKEGVHFGTIPGTDKPTIYQPGAQIMAGVYRYAASYAVEHAFEADRVKRWQRKKKRWDNSQQKMVGVYDESGQAVMEDIVTTGRYEVTVACTLTHMGSGVIVGQGVGSCNSWEKKYAPLEVDDVKNTVLKIAKKRAYNDAVLTACRLSDFFTQDVEDMVAHDDATEAADIPYPAAQAATDEQTSRQEPGPPQKPTGVVPNPYVGKLAKVEVIRKGENDKGDWRLWAIRTTDKLTFKTFSDGPAKFCQKALAEDAAVKIEWSLSDRNDMMVGKVFRAAA